MAPAAGRQWSIFRFSRTQARQALIQPSFDLAAAAPRCPPARRDRQQNRSHGVPTHDHIEVFFEARARRLVRILQEWNHCVLQRYPRWDTRRFEVTVVGDALKSQRVTVVIELREAARFIPARPRFDS